MKSKSIMIKILAIMLCAVTFMGLMSAEIRATETANTDTKGTVTIKYQDKDGNSILDEQTMNGNVGDEYEVARKNITGYKAYGVTPRTAKGQYTKDNIEVVFVYQKNKSEEVVVKYIDESGNYIRRDKTIVGNNGDDYETTAEEVDGYKHTKTNGEEKGKITYDGKEITYTYKKSDKNSKNTEWSTEKTLIAIAGAVIILIIIFIVIAKLEKKSKISKEDKDNKSVENSDKE